MCLMQRARMCSCVGKPIEYVDSDVNFCHRVSVYSDGVDFAINSTLTQTADEVAVSRGWKMTLRGEHRRERSARSVSF